MDTKNIVNDFLLKYNMSSSSINIDSVLNDFEQEMSRGLSGDESSLAMIASYINANDSVPLNKPVIVLDAGGTNLRVCTVSFDEYGNADIEHFSQYQMPGIICELSAKEFYNTICDYLEPVINRSDSIGFCFSYPSEITPNKDGKLLYWTKEVKVPELVGQYIGTGLLNALSERGYSDKKVVLLNDTVSSLLAGKSVGEQRKCDGYIGFILGTGTNTAYVEANKNIPVVSSNDGSQVINIESGNFSKCPQGHIDKVYDSSTNNPGCQTLEKMISGRYLGTLTLFTIMQAVEDGLFSDDARKNIESIKNLETEDLSIFLDNPFNAVSPFSSSLISKQDRELLYYIVMSLVERAAKLTAINMAAAVIKSGSGKSPVNPICINVDGSTFHKLHGFRTKCEAILNDILSPLDIHFKTIEVENAPIIGTAIAGLVG